MTDDREARRERLSAPKRALLDRRLRGEAAGTPLPAAIPPRPDPARAPLSYAQERLWFLERLEPGTALYTIPALLPLPGAVDVRALEESLQEIVRRHEILRTTFSAVDGDPVQVIAPAMPLPLAVVDLSSLPPAERRAQRDAAVADVTRQPFDLARGPLLRAALLRDPDAGQDTLVLAMHHIVADAWSVGLMFDELLALYPAFAAGLPSPLPELPIQYADYAVWQRGWLTGPVLDEQVDYWKRQLDGIPALRLPTDRLPPAVASRAGARQSVALSGAAVAAIRALAQRDGASVFMTLLAALVTLLHRYTGQDDIAIGTPIAGRTRAEVERVIGFFLNTLVLRVDVGGDPPFRDLLQRVRAVAMAAYAHQDVPFERLLAEVHSERHLGRTPLFQMFFNHFVDHHPRAGATERLRPEASEVRFDLTLYAIERDRAIELQATYRTDLFDDATIARMLIRLETLLGAVTDRPDRRVSALLLEQPGGGAGGVTARPDHGGPAAATWRGGTDQGIPARFASIVARYPDRRAVESEATVWTYAELADAAARIAGMVRSRLGGAEGRVALLFGHDAPMIAALLGALIAGKAYVPLELANPRARLREILDDADVAAIVTDGRHADMARALAGGNIDVIDIDQGAPAMSAGHAAADHQAEAHAYILYTSGSTGRPKGVVQSQRNVLGHIGAYTASLGISPHDRLTLLASYGFDAAVMDIFGALLNGAALCLFDVREHGPDALARWVSRRAISIYHSTPTVYRQIAGLIETARPLRDLRFVVLGGEEVTARDVALYRDHFPPTCTLVNGFGPTECTVALQYFLSHRTTVSRHHGVPIGYPVAGTEVALLNPDGEEVGVYGIGEIVIRSAHVALGYWRRPEQTRAAFPGQGQHPSQCAYRTGDLGRRLPDASIAFAGRKDAQVKLRGHRIDAGEIEAALLAHASIRDAVVALRNDSAGEPRLVAYVVPQPGDDVRAGPLHRFLKERLPPSMLPATFVPLARLPVTSSGKVDRRRLPAPPRASASDDAPVVPPRTPIEETLGGICAELLGLERVGVTEDFFELGGHSLLLMRLQARVRDRFSVELPLRRLFEAPTVAQLAEAVEEARMAEGPGAGAIRPQPREPYRRTLAREP